MAGTMAHALIMRGMACGLALATIGASAASAAPLLFTFTGGGNTYVTTIDSNPTPSFFFTGGFTGVNTTGTLNGTPFTPNNSAIFFKPSFGYGHAFTFDDSYESLYVTTNALYSGTEQNPIFAPGTFNGILYGGSTPGQLKISALGAGGPGAPAPDIGGGLFAGFAAFAAFALTRMRRSPWTNPAA